MPPSNILIILKQYLTGSQWHSVANLLKNHPELIQFLIENNEWKVLEACFRNLPAAESIDINAIITINNTTCSVLWHIVRRKQLEIFDLAVAHSSNPDLNIKPHLGEYSGITIFNFLAAFKQWGRLTQLMVTFKKLDLSSIKVNQLTQKPNLPILYDALEEKRYDVIHTMQEYHPQEFYRNLGYCLFSEKLLPRFRSALTQLKQQNISVDLNHAPYGNNSEIAYHNELFSNEHEGLLAGISLALIITLRLTKSEPWETETLLTLTHVFTYHQPIDVNLTALALGIFHNTSIFKILYQQGHTNLLAVHFSNFAMPNACFSEALTNFERDQFYDKALSAIGFLKSTITENTLHYWVPIIIRSFDNAIALGHPSAQCHAVMFYGDLFKICVEKNYKEEALQLLSNQMKGVYVIFLDNLLFELGNFCASPKYQLFLLAITFLSEALMLAEENTDTFKAINVLLLNIIAVKLGISNFDSDFSLIQTHKKFIELIQSVLIWKTKLFNITLPKNITPFLASLVSAPTLQALCKLTAVKHLNPTQYQLAAAQIPFFAKSAPRLIMKTDKTESIPQNDNNAIYASFKLQ